MVNYLALFCYIFLPFHTINSYFIAIYSVEGKWILDTLGADTHLIGNGMTLEIMFVVLPLMTGFSGCPDSDKDDTGVDSGSYGSTEPADGDGDGYTEHEGDCDDSDPAVNPDVLERCDDGIDNDCDGLTDREQESCDDSELTCDDPDSDGDGYDGCDDCDDDDATVNPSATEICDGIDNDCDGLTDDADPDQYVGTLPTWYLDADSDGYGSSSIITICSQPDGYVASNGDCDDLDSANFPGNDEVCDGRDNDCDSLTDEADAVDATTWCLDDEEDEGDATVIACNPPDGYITCP